MSDGRPAVPRPAHTALGAPAGHAHPAAGDWRLHHDERGPQVEQAQVRASPPALRLRPGPRTLAQPGPPPTPASSSPSSSASLVPAPPAAGHVQPPAIAPKQPGPPAGDAGPPGTSHPPACAAPRAPCHASLSRGLSVWDPERSAACPSGAQHTWGPIWQARLGGLAAKPPLWPQPKKTLPLCASASAGRPPRPRCTPTSLPLLSPTGQAGGGRSGPGPVPRASVSREAGLALRTRPRDLWRSPRVRARPPLGRRFENSV